MINKQVTLRSMPRIWEGFKISPSEDIFLTIIVRVCLSCLSFSGKKDNYIQLRETATAETHKDPGSYFERQYVQGKLHITLDKIFFSFFLRLVYVMIHIHIKPTAK